ncbi:MAG: hypothetical protein GX856_04380, partial [Gammaproteobacteria bacterium]|nr:hypothetical protein [Gammaproteobacteria bacterium]
VLDRVKSGSDSLDPIYNSEYTGPRMAGNQVRKTFVLHATGTGSSGSGNPFTVGNATATAAVGSQRMDLRTLVPAAPAYRVISEGGTVGQYRLEYDVSGTEMSYLLNVVSARDAAEAAVSVTMNDLGDSWQIQLSHPQKGSATVVLRKGETTAGGSVRVGGGAAQPLREDVQGMLLTADGPVWTGGGTPPPGPSVPTGGNQPAVSIQGSGSAGAQALPQPVGSPASPAAATDAAQATGDTLARRIARVRGFLLDAWRRSVEWLLAIASGADAAAPATAAAPAVPVVSATAGRGDTLQPARHTERARLAR